jgi:hypothetical protein
MGASKAAVVAKYVHPLPTICLGDGRSWMYLRHYDLAAVRCTIKLARMGGWGRGSGDAGTSRMGMKGKIIINNKKG